MMEAVPPDATRRATHEAIGTTDWSITPATPEEIQDIMEATKPAGALQMRPEEVVDLMYDTLRSLRVIAVARSQCTDVCNSTNEAARRKTAVELIKRCITEGIGPAKRMLETRNIREGVSM